MGKNLNQSSKWKRSFLKVLLVIIFVLIILWGALIAFLWSKLELIQYENEVDNAGYHTEPGYTEGNINSAEGVEEEIVDISGLETVETAPVIPKSEVFGEENVVNILLIGTDERTKEFNNIARSDSMILVSVDKDQNSVKLVSFERGMGVPVLEGIYKGEYDWLTHIFRYGGSELLTNTVEHCFKVDINHYVRINFNSVIQVVDAVGGIEIELTEAEARALNKGLDNDQKKLVEGLNTINGSTALSFARLRVIDSDWQRVQRQRKVILAVVDTLQESSLTELNLLADKILPLIQTNMSKLEIAELILYAPHFLQASFDQMTIPQQGTYDAMTVMGDRAAYAVDFEANNEILYEFLYGSDEE